MNFGIITTGSRGDVEPFISLALGLMERGHGVTLMANENFKDQIGAYGINFHSLWGNSEEFNRSPEFHDIHNKGSNFLLFKFLRRVNKNRTLLYKSVLDGCNHVDVLIVNNLFALVVNVAVEKLGLKWINVTLNPPMIPTKLFPAPHFRPLHFPAYNLLSYYIVQRLFLNIYKNDVKDFRKMVGLPSDNKSLYRILKEKKILTIHSFSSQLIPRPSDWPEQYQITGPLVLAEKYKPKHYLEQIPADLERWISSGAKPVFLSFGSIPVPDPSVLNTIIMEILQTTSTRIIFSLGWSILEDLPVHNNLFVVKAVNHQWLFPKCACAIIHGGVGTLTAVLRAGIPVIICSIYTDQPAWGKIVADKGVGYHIPWRKLTVSRLLKAVDGVKDQSIQKKVSDISEKMNKENGVKEAIDAIEKHLREK